MRRRRRHTDDASSPVTRCRHWPGTVERRCLPQPPRPSPALAGLKHLGRLEQVLAAAEVQASGWDEGLMLDDFGNVVEATRHNLFYLRAGQLWTPPLEYGGVAGVMRALLLELLPGLGLLGGEAPLPAEHLREIDALLLCNAVTGLCRAGEVDGQTLGGADLLERLRQPLAAAGATWSG
jgi:4-amino-4-deoxychorismate lyase